MSRFQTANDIAVLFGARKLQWEEQTPSDSAPTTATDGVKLERDAVRVMLALKPDTGTMTIRAYGYLAALSDWYEIPQIGEVVGTVEESGYVERFNLSAFQRVYIRTDPGANVKVHVGQTILE
jgi:hypothetical protein